MTVLLFPPRAFLSSLVSMESLNGTRTFFPVELSANAAMQFPRLLRDWLIAAPSFSLSPVAPVLAALSLRKYTNFYNYGSNGNINYLFPLYCFVLEISCSALKLSAEHEI